MNRELIIAIVVAAGAGSALASGCTEVRGNPVERHADNCTTCHGSPVRDGTPLMQSAPPVDLEGKTATSRRGVGAHLIHLTDSDITAPVACSECHVVPETTDSPGHADDALPADITFGDRAKLGDRNPTYDSQAVACADTYCHYGKEVSWFPSAVAMPRCGRCHESPPAAPHPADDRCSLCHGEVVDDALRIIDLNKHIDGEVQVQVGCDTCHGSGEEGSPPPDLLGNTDVESVGVGAHVAHLEGGMASRPLACTECHDVPDEVGDEGHLADGTPNAEVALVGVAETDDRSPMWDRMQRRCVDSWCHSPSQSMNASPLWTSTSGPLGCEGCHGNPPAAPHPQMAQCTICHAPVVNDAGGIAMRELHVDGVVQVLVPTTCDGCHGNDPTGAPPPDLSGNTDPSFSGVGAHQIHLEGDPEFSRQVVCEDCHQVPATVLESGHVDTALPAEIVFGAVASAYGATPTYDGTTCSETWCHGGKTVFDFPSGGTNTEPGWTDPPTGKTCVGCHGFPPPTPAHPTIPGPCNPCHSNVNGLADFFDPTLHINGIVDL